MPFPAGIVEEQYSQGVYLRFQPLVTSATNLVPIALLDVAAAIVLMTAAVFIVRNIRRQGVRTASLRGVIALITAAAIVFLVFLATWGLNYQRLPLERKLDFHEDRLTADAAVRLTTIAIERVNAGYEAAHRTPMNIAALEHAFVEGQHLLGSDTFAKPGRAKRSLVQPYFRWTAINGMTVPGFLEVILHPDLLPYEVPFTLAHEWGHLAGYADESEANFFAWLICVRSDNPLINYSGWLEGYGLALQGVPRSARSSLPDLDAGPKQDLRAIRVRLERSSPRARLAARGVYDSYLKANRVEEGVRSYDRALRLMLGTTFQETWKPVAR